MEVEGRGLGLASWLGGVWGVAVGVLVGGWVVIGGWGTDLLEPCCVRGEKGVSLVKSSVGDRGEEVGEGIGSCC